MAVSTVKLGVGETVKIEGVEVTVAKCGMTKQGNQPVVPSVTLQWGEPDEEPAEGGQGGDQGGLQGNQPDLP